MKNAAMRTPTLRKQRPLRLISAAGVMFVAAVIATVVILAASATSKPAVTQRRAVSDWRAQTHTKSGYSPGVAAGKLAALYSARIGPTDSRARTHANSGDELASPASRTASACAPDDTRPVGPGGELLAGPARHEETILTADLDLGTVRAARRLFDPVGHYNRPDVFQLSVDTRHRTAVSLEPAGELTGSH